MNAVEREPVPIRVLNPNASEASYKPKQRSYRKMKLHFFFRGDFFRGNFVGGLLPKTVYNYLHRGVGGRAGRVEENYIDSAM